MTPKLAAALVTAQKSVGVARKDGLNSAEGRNYATTDELVATGKAALAEAGLALFPLGLDLQHVEVPEGVRVDMVRHYALVHESGESITLPVRLPVHFGKGNGPDQAVAACSSYGLGLAYRDLLGIPRRTWGEPEVDQRPQQVEVRRGQAEIQESERRAKSGAALPDVKGGAWIKIPEPPVWARKKLDEASIGAPLRLEDAPFAPNDSHPASPAPLSPEGANEATRPDGAVSSGAPTPQPPAPEATPLASGAGEGEEAPLVQPTPSQVQVVGQIAENVSAPAKKRGRGRPRGSKNRPKEGSPVEPEEKAHGS